MNNTKRNLLYNNIEKASSIIQDFINNNKPGNDSNNSFYENRIDEYVQKRIEDRLKNISDEDISIDNIIDQNNYVNFLYLITSIKECLKWMVDYNSNNLNNLTNEDICNNILTFISNYDNEKKEIEEESESIMNEAEEELKEEENNNSEE